MHSIDKLMEFKILNIYKNVRAFTGYTLKCRFCSFKIFNNLYKLLEKSPILLLWKDGQCYIFALTLNSTVHLEVIFLQVTLYSEQSSTAS